MQLVFDEGLPLSGKSTFVMNAKDVHWESTCSTVRGMSAWYDILKRGYGPVSTDDEAVVELLDDLRLDRIVENHGF